MSVLQLTVIAIKLVLMRSEAFTVCALQDTLSVVMALAAMVRRGTFPVLNSLVFSDVNECTSHTDGCGQHCHNTVGSYYCSCNVGYRLNSNNRTCDGMW